MVINVTGGNIGDHIAMGGNSTLNIDTTPLYAPAMNVSGGMQSKLNIRGGQYDMVTVFENSKLDFSNGYIRELYVNHNNNYQYGAQATYISGAKSIISGITHMDSKSTIFPAVKYSYRVRVLMIVHAV